MFSCERIDSWEDVENFKGWADTGHVKLKGGTLKAEILALCSLIKLLTSDRAYQQVPKSTKHGKLLTSPSTKRTQNPATAPDTPPQADTKAPDYQHSHSAWQRNDP